MQIFSLMFTQMCAYVNLFILFAALENSVPKAGTEEISLKLTTLPNESPPGSETECLKTQTEGATAKVIISGHTRREFLFFHCYCNLTHSACVFALLMLAFF